MNSIPKDLTYLIGTSGIIVMILVGVMFFSTLSSHFIDEEGMCRGGSWSSVTSLKAVDSLITMKSKNLPAFPYFDRFLPENERYIIANSRADIYELEWIRIEILSRLNHRNELIESLKDYSKITGYNQDEALQMLIALK